VKLIASSGALVLAAVLWLATAAWLAAAPAQSTFAVGDSDFLMNGKLFQIKAGEMHPARFPDQSWADRLKMAHAMGLNTVAICFFWNQHEPRQGQFPFTGDADIARFVRLAQKEGLWVILRPGPCCGAEGEFGGFPWWLLKEHDLKVRSPGPNEMVVFEQLKDPIYSLAAIKSPILDQLNNDENAPSPGPTSEPR
jgi:beta-galactosidase